MKPNNSNIVNKKVFLFHFIQTGHNSYFFLEEAVEDKDEHPLQGVKDCEEVCHDNRGLVQEEQAK